MYLTGTQNSTHTIVHVTHDLVLAVVCLHNCMYSSSLNGFLSHARVRMSSANLFSSFSFALRSVMNDCTSTACVKDYINSMNDEWGWGDNMSLYKIKVRNKGSIMYTYISKKLTEEIH